MESGWRNLSDSSCSGGDGSGGQNGLFTNNAWDNWDIGTTAATRYDWSNHDVCGNIPAATAAARGSEASVVHALLLGVASNDVNRHLDAGVGSTHQRIADPHMMCLKLGKRHYCEDAVVAHRHMAAESSSTKRGKPPCPYYITDAITTTTTTTVWPPSSAVTIPSSPAAVPRCQVEGCHVALSNAKEYYRRHKVCEIHSKAPKVVVLGLQQRFCQQCSRFHGVTEFDETKRSCRRRLEGHNQRRRKGTLSHHHENNLMVKGRFRSLEVLPPSPPPPPPLPSKPGCARSLLSYPKIETWISSDDLSSRCSAALWELIVENRATAIFGQFWDQNSSQQPISENAIDMLSNAQMWNRLNGIDHTTTTLDLMQASTSDFGLLSMKEKSKDPEESPDYCWSAFGGTHVV